MPDSGLCESDEAHRTELRPRRKRIEPERADDLGRVPIVLPPPFKRELGHCWTLTLSHLPQAAMLAELADGDGPYASSRSPAWLHEDGVPLGPAHALHAAIRDTGGGLFSHWQDTLYFSTSDGSDPNTNGRRYEIVVTVADATGNDQADESRINDHDRQNQDVVELGRAGSELAAPSGWSNPSGAGAPDGLSLHALYYVLQSRRLVAEADDDTVAGAPSKREISSLERRIVDASGRFDEAFYRRSYGASIDRSLSPLDHFMTTGCEQGLLASAQFDPVVYKILHPVREHANPLVDCIVRGDKAAYRDARALFTHIGAGKIPLDIRYLPHLRAEWAAQAPDIVKNRDRSGRIPGPGFDYELRNPSPDAVWSRFAANKPFYFARLPHGFWDDFSACRKVAARLRTDPRCRFLNQQELFNLGMRLLACSRNFVTFPCFEGYYPEIEADLFDNPRDADFWTSVALTGVPTLHGLHGFNEEDVKDRAELLACFFGQSDVLYDAMLWKRWALSGDLAKLPDVVRDHPVILVGPPQFGSLGQMWQLPVFHHLVIPTDYSYVIRQRILESLSRLIEGVLGAARERRPVVLFQCSGDLSYWLMRRLRPHYRDVFCIDVGQALDLWHWQPESVWAQIFGDAVRAANPFVGASPGQHASQANANSVSAGSLDEVLSIFRTDYLETDLVAPAPRPLVPITGRFEACGANGWAATLPAELGFLTDDDDGPLRSPLRLLEDGKSLGEGHNRHTDIFELGGGRYSFWKGFLYFSTSDNSDPNRNGRCYSVGGRTFIGVAGG